MDSQPLKAINILKKLCNHPDLLNLAEDLKGSEKLLPPDYVITNGVGRGSNRNPVVRSEWGGKFLVLERLVMVYLGAETLLTWCP